MARLSAEEIAERLAGTEWRSEGDEIVRELEFADFAAAIAFVNRVAAAAESANHHPDLLVHDYKAVRVSLSTHSEGGVTASDFELAAEIDELA